MRKAALSLLPPLLLGLIACQGDGTLEPPNPVTGAEGAWSNPATWGGAAPGPNSAVTIPAGKTVVLDVSAEVRSVTVLGNLVWADSDGLELKAGHVMVHGPGLFRIGAQAAPFSKKATLTLTGNNPAENIMGMGTKFLGAMMGGRIEIWGEPRVSWTKLNATAQAGATQLTLAENPNWRAGERVVVASSTFNPDEAEERTITAVAGNTLTLDRPLAHRHYGQLQAFGGRTLDSRAEVGLLSRNIVIQGDEGSAASRLGGHVMVMGADAARRETNPALRSSAKVRGVEFRRLGQFDRLGRYPFHWHQNGDSAGDFLEDSAVHSSIQRGIVVHGTDGVAVRDNVVYKTPGHAYMVEDGTEQGSLLERNLGLLPQPVRLTAAGLSTQNDSGAAVFWLRTAAATLTGNSAAGGQFAGYWFDMADNETSKLRLVFRDNTVHSHRSAPLPGTERDSWAVWHTDGFVAGQQQPLGLERLTAYKNLRAVETLGRGVVTDSILADNGKAISQVLLRDSTVVSRSANADTEGAWGQTGMFAYGGFAHAEGVTWVGFRGDRRIAGTLACGIELPRFSNRGATLVDSDPAAGCGDVILHDRDGSLAGTGRPQKLVWVEGRPGFGGAGANGFGLFTAECRAVLPGRPDGYAVCPDYDYRTLGVTYPSGAAGVSTNPDWRVDVVREEDGDRVTPDHFRWISYVIPGRAYRLEVRSRRTPADATVRPLETLPYVNLALSTGDLSDPDPPAGGRNTVYDPAWRGRTLTVSAPAPGGNYRVRRCSGEAQCGGDPAGWPVVAAASLAALQSGGGSGYAVEGGRIHFRFFGGDQLRFERQ